MVKEDLVFSANLMEQPSSTFAHVEENIKTFKKAMQIYLLCLT